MGTALVALATAIIQLASNRMALGRMRAEMETDPAEKKRVIDETLIVADSVRKVWEWVQQKVDHDGNDKVS